MQLESYIRDIEDFPKKGILYKDITPLLNNSNAFDLAFKTLLDLVNTKVNKVVAIESRGFLFGTHLAQKLNAGFVPVRKKGKLPYHTIAKAYDLEYGQDVLEMHTDAIKKGDLVLLHDDVLATGGTAKAVCQMVEELGGTIVQCNFLIELKALQGRTKIANYQVESAMIF